MPHREQPELTDSELLRSIAAGDRLAFQAFVRRHEAAVYRYAHALSERSDDAADALQETFIAAWQHAGSFRGQGSARGWLLRIARNAAYRQARRQKERAAPTVALEQLAVEAGWGDSAAERITEQLYAREQVAAGFRDLSAEDREILLLRDLEGLSGEEVAQQLGVSLAAQKSRLHRARLRFIASLRGQVANGA